MNYQTIQENISALLQLRGITQKELAEKVGAQPLTVNRWVRGKKGKPTQIPKAQLERIASAFGITYDELISPDLIGSVLDDMFNTKYLTEVSSLISYLASFGIRIDLEEDRREMVVEPSSMTYLELPIYKTVKLEWENEKGKTVAKTISYATFESLAQRTKEHAMIEIQHL